MSRVLILVLVLGACSPVDDAVAQASTECRSAIDGVVAQVETDAWRICTDMYEAQEAENEVNYANGCRVAIQAERSHMMTEWMLTHGCREVWTQEHGNVWSCSGTEICELAQ